MGKGSNIEVVLERVHNLLLPWKMKMKKMTKLHGIVVTILLLGSCSASFLMFTTMILANTNLLSIYKNTVQESVSCDFSHYCTSYCHVKGDVRVNNHTVSLISTNRTTERIAGIRPYTRKWEKMMKTIPEVSIFRTPSRSVRCQVKHSVPAIIFSTGGYTGSVFHDFNDGFVPLFITSAAFNREVIFIVSDLKAWWPSKYRHIIRELTNYSVIDLDRQRKVHCFPESIVGLQFHSDLTIDPKKSRKTMGDFQELLERALNNKQNSLPSRNKPKMVIANRQETRKILNQNDTVKLAERLGYEVEIFTPNFHTRLTDIYPMIHSADVFLGVHGAALTHFLFMKPNSTLVQIIPFGLDDAAEKCFGLPAVRAGLNYVGYRLQPLESTLSEKFGENHTVLMNPREVVARGWQERKRVYLDGQNVKLSLPRVEGILRDVLRRLQP